MTLDSWTRRYITFMELGGNAKANEFYKKNGLKRPIDYKSQISLRYKADLEKKVNSIG